MPNSTPKVSVIVPAFNAQNFISQAIRSVQNQTWQQWELIAVNDGSTDETEAVITEFLKQDARIRLITQANGKLANARNTGIAAACGEFIAFLDADDLWQPAKLEKQIGAYDDTNADVIFTDAFHFPEDFPGLPFHLFGKWVGFFPGAEMFRKMYANNAIPVSSVLWHRGGPVDDCRFDERLRNLEDYEMWLRLASRGASFFGIGEKLVGYRSHDLQMSRHIVSMLKSAINVRQKYRSIALKNGIDLANQDRVDQRAMAYCSANAGEYRLAYSTILKLCQVGRFGIRGLINAMGATAHLVYHIIIGH